jgi:hypothetical protein
MVSIPEIWTAHRSTTLRHHNLKDFTGAQQLKAAGQALWISSAREP